MTKILLTTGIFMLSFLNAYARAETAPQTPVPDNSFYAYETPTPRPAPLAHGRDAQRTQERSVADPQPPRENIDFLDGLTARKRGDTTYFSTGVVCQGKDDIAVCS